MTDSDREQLKAIKTFPSLVKYLRDELDWPIDADDFDDLTFDYEPEELGIDAKTAPADGGLIQQEIIPAGRTSRSEGVDYTIGSDPDQLD